jgi:hypothetical protein
MREALALGMPELFPLEGKTKRYSIYSRVEREKKMSTIPSKK